MSHLERAVRTGRTLRVALTRRLAQLPARAGARRPARWVACATLAGAVAITGPWAVSAIGQEEPPDPPTASLRHFLGGVVDGAPGDRAGLGPYYGELVEEGWDRPLQPWYWRPAAEPVWAPPVSGYPVSASYGTPGGWAAGYHTGVDFAVPVGTPVHSVGPGTVISAGYAGDYGNQVTVALADGYFALYAHLSDIAVEPGQSVTAESWLGDSGNSGRSTGPHLHFEVRASNYYGADVDPLDYLARRGVDIG
ncbi:M23 family metallopeptidase [Streptomyces sp. DSM 44915]|uniref:M23 family metallopeptidase n=1 Tax=Streptomyces chisholmiae TaxID=3075540 RepID=A0ABU2JW48_9ACTN|nr:M23 family metallopeptidase [Streptomyces sp. DSM 44915]MDT0269189.1 M23 family metallopeptidase [Streptomyces sp. DSM 44915]